MSNYRALLYNYLYLFSCKLLCFFPLLSPVVCFFSVRSLFIRTKRRLLSGETVFPRRRSNFFAVSAFGHGARLEKKKKQEEAAYNRRPENCWQSSRSLRGKSRRYCGSYGSPCRAAEKREFRSLGETIIIILIRKLHYLASFPPSSPSHYNANAISCRYLPTVVFRDGGSSRVFREAQRSAT